MTTRRRQRGSVILLYIMAIALTAAILAASMNWRRASARQAMDAWAFVAADALAQAGVEAGRASILTKAALSPTPLGPKIKLGRGVGQLRVKKMAKNEQYVLVSCGEVEAFRIRNTRVCWKATLNPDGAYLGLELTETKSK